MSDSNNQQVLAGLLKAAEPRENEADDTVIENSKKLVTEEVIDLGDFDFDGFQVVRREFFAHMFEPAASFNNCKFYVNSACLAKFPEADFVQVLINQESRIMALRPCHEGERDSYAWCNVSKGKRKPKQTTCKLFFAKVVTMMGWNPDYRYKLLGKLIHANGEYLLAFDLTATEVYQRTFAEGAKPKTSKTPTFPASWQNQFGLPFNEHRQSMQINIFDGYAIYALKDNSASTGGEAEVAEQMVMQKSAVSSGGQMR